MTRRRSGLIALLVLSAGCSQSVPTENIPRFASLPTVGVLAVLNRRAAATRTVSGETAITLTRPDGQAVQLDGAVVLALPDQARVRAWKFGQAVFDLTLTPAGVWMFSAQSGPPPAGVGSAIAQWVRLLGGDFTGWPVSDDRADKLTLRHDTDDGQMRCDVDRATATARRFRFVDRNGVVRFQMLLSHYTLVNELAWPMQVVVQSAGGRVQIDWRDVQINQGVPPAAFRPPRRAVKIEGEPS